MCYKTAPQSAHDAHLRFGQLGNQMHSRDACITLNGAPMGGSRTPSLGTMGSTIVSCTACSFCCMYRTASTPRLAGGRFCFSRRATYNRLPVAGWPAGLIGGCCMGRSTFGLDTISSAANGWGAPSVIALGSRIRFRVAEVDWSIAVFGGAGLLVGDWATSDKALALAGGVAMACCGAAPSFAFTGRSSLKASTKADRTASCMISMQQSLKPTIAFCWARVCR
mmetsp:Transcript_110002/g.190537  ORF Transcript_110002/g.190537 Transcript_110002/m.190537 type:complete len:223 (+) Transcript_110002:674-1342(+)